MSVMSDLAMRIEEMCYDGLTDAEIAKRLNIPVSMVTGYLGEEITEYMRNEFDKGFEDSKFGSILYE